MTGCCGTRCHRSLVVFLPLLALLASPPAHAARESLGTLGATVETDAWVRVNLSDDLGKDQFHRAEGDHYLLVFEHLRIFEQRSDFERLVETTISNVRQRLADFRGESEMSYERGDAFTRAMVRARGSVNGLDLAYQVDLVSAGDGVGYLFLSWSGASNAEAHGHLLDQWVEGLHLPGEDTPWAAKRRITPHRLNFGRHTVELSFADSIFSPSDGTAGKHYSFVADQAEVALHIFVAELEGAADAVLDRVVNVALSNHKGEVLQRGDLDLPIGKGRYAVVRKAAAGTEGGFDAAIAVVEIEAGHWLDLRLASDAATGHRDGLWQRLLAGLKVTSAPKLDAFPEATVARVTARPLHPAAGTLATGSRRLASVGWPAWAVLMPNGDLVSWKDYNEAELLRYPAADAAAEPQSVLRLDTRPQGPLASWGEDLFALTSGGEVQRLTAGGLEPAGFRADAAKARGEELLIAREPERQRLLGLGELPKTGATAVLLRQRSGEERTLLELADRRVKTLALGPEAALVAAEPWAQLWSAETGAPRTELHLVARTGGSRLVGRWQAVTRLEASPSGWLLSGTNEDGVAGVFLLSGPELAGRELLLSGDQAGLRLDEQGLTFATNLCRDEEELRYCVYRAPLELVRRHGPGLAPFPVTRLAAIASRAAEAAGGISTLHPLPPDRGTLDRFLAAAGKFARETAGWPLPETPSAIDRLFDDLSGEEALTPALEALLASLLAQSLLTEGATWAAAGSGAPDPYGALPSSPFALAASPAAIVREAGGEEGWHSPLSTLAQQAQGRPIFVGPDAGTLGLALRAAQPAELEATLTRGSEKAVTALLEERRENLFLREEVYSHLAAHGRLAVLAKVAESFAAAPDAPALDVVASTAARLKGQLSPKQSEELVAKLRAAIEKAPRDARLYLLLGALYERTERKDRAALAKACYEQVTRVSNWGANAEDAKAALERLAEVP